MKILAIEMENYGPFYGRHRLELDGRGLVLVLGDNRDEPRMNSNGAGKSSLIDAFDWAAFGVHPRGDSPDTLINDEAAALGHGARVTLFAEDQDASLRIERCRKFEGFSGVRLFCDGEDVSSMDAKETQRYVEWHLGLDRQVFRNTVLFAQGDMAKFADSTDGERIEILTKILRLELIDAWQGDAKDALRGAEGQLLELQRQEAALQGQLQGLASIDDSAAEADFERRRAERAAWLAQEIEAVEAQLSAAQAQARRAQDARAAIDRHTAEPPPPPEALARAQADLEMARRQGGEARAYAGHARAEAEQAQRRRQLLAAGQCPQCEQAIPEALRQAADAGGQAQQAAADKASAVAGRWAAYEAQIAAVLQAAQADYAQAQATHQRQLGELQATWAQAAQAAQGVEQLAARRQSFKLEVQSNAAAQNPALQERAARQKQSENLQQQVFGAGQKRGEIGAEAGRIKFWAEAFGPKGLKSYILDARLAEMTDAANEWVRLLTGGTYWIRLETTAALKSGAIRNRFVVRVFCGRGGEVTERNYKSWSGGQKQRVSLAIDFGLSRLVARRAAKSYDLLFLDEIFKHLDASGRDAVMEMLHRLREEKSSIFVVDHDAEFQALFEQRVVVRMQDGRASILQGEQPDDRHRSRATPLPAAADESDAPRAEPPGGDPVPPGAAGGEAQRGGPQDPGGGGGVAGRRARPRRSPVRQRAGKNEPQRGP